MNVTITPQLRAIVLVGVLGIVALALGLMAMNRLGSSSTTTAPPTIKPLHRVHPLLTHPAKAVRATHHRAVTHPGSKPFVPYKVKAAAGTVAPRTAVVPKSPVAPRIAAPTPVKPAPTAAPNGLPFVVAHALVLHPVVVVALYQSSREATAAQRKQALQGTSVAAAVGIDQLSLGEAAAGARDAHAGFVGVDVLSEHQASPLAALIGPLADPTVLVYRRPSTLTATLTGFADRDTVAQAAANADPAASFRVPANAWATATNAVCRTTFSKLGPLNSKSPATVTAWKASYDRATAGFLVKVRAIPAPLAAERELTQLYARQVTVTNVGLVAMAGKNSAALRAWSRRAAPLNARVGTLQAQVGVTDCALHVQ